MALVEMLEEEFKAISEAVRLANGFHRRRDQMNAILHCAEDVRWSPLTEKLNLVVQVCIDVDEANKGRPA